MPIANRRHSRLPICATGFRTHSATLLRFELYTGLPKAANLATLHPMHRDKRGQMLFP